MSLLTQFVKFSNGKVWPVDANGFITAQVHLNLSVLTSGMEEVNDTVSETLTGSIRLTDLGYTLIQAREGQALLEVCGSIDDFDDDGEDSPEPATLEQFANSRGWSDFEKSHANHAVGLKYGDEAVLQLPNGRALHCPAFPSRCDYVRLVDLGGYELAYWVCDEWQNASDGDDVMGAILGSMMA